jgi:hypothetical protein
MDELLKRLIELKKAIDATIVVIKSTMEKNGNAKKASEDYEPDGYLNSWFDVKKEENSNENN